MYLDIHTHHQYSGASIYNLAPGEKPAFRLFSAGVHPWHANTHSCASATTLLEQMNTSEYFAAVGEVGIDRACNIPILQQTTIFECQLRWACQHDVPCIIHCVRAYSDILQVLKRNTLRPPIIFHAYAGNPQITAQLTQAGAFFSLGMRELHHMDNIKHIPIERLFLETDEQDIPIGEVYEEVAKRLCMSIEGVCQIVEQNANSLWQGGLSFV